MLLDYKLHPATKEAEFRASRDSAIQRQLIWIFSLTAAFIAIFALIEALSFYDKPGIVPSLLARSVGLAACAAALLKLRTPYRSARHEGFIFACGLAIVLHIVANNAAQPFDPISISAWDIGAIFVIYAVTPIRLGYQVALAAALSIGAQAVWLTSFAPDLEPVSRAVTPIAYLAANLFGILISRHHKKVLRSEFLHLIEEKSLRQSLEENMQKLEEASKTRDHLFSLIAHDLKSPIGALHSISKILKNTNALEVVKRDKLIDMLNESSRASYELLDNLLHWALSESGKLQPEFEKINVAKIIENNLNLLSGNAADKKIQLLHEGSGQTEIIADRNMLATIIRNLLANAIKFTNQGGYARISHRQTSEGSIEIIVQDNGIGIPPQKLSRLFDLDLNERSQGTSGEQGSNLGLRVVHGFTKMHHGTIQATSRPQEGTEIKVTLPLKQLRH